MTTLRIRLWVEIQRNTAGTGSRHSLIPGVHPRDGLSRTVHYGKQGCPAERSLPVLLGVGSQMAQALRVLFIGEAGADVLLAELREGGYDLTFETVASRQQLDKALSGKWDIAISD